MLEGYQLVDSSQYLFYFFSKDRYDICIFQICRKLRNEQRIIEVMMNEMTKYVCIFFN